MGTGERLQQTVPGMDPGKRHQWRGRTWQTRKGDQEQGQGGQERSLGRVPGSAYRGQETTGPTLGRGGRKQPRPFAFGQDKERCHRLGGTLEKGSGLEGPTGSLAPDRGKWPGKNGPAGL